MLKNSSRDLQANCAISFCFYLYLMLHTYAVRLDVKENLEKLKSFSDLVQFPKFFVFRALLFLFSNIIQS